MHHQRSEELFTKVGAGYGDQYTVEIRGINEDNLEN